MSTTATHGDGTPDRHSVILNPAFAEYVARMNSAGVFGNPAQLGPQFDNEQRESTT